MKHPETGETAVPLTRSQVEALDTLAICEPAPHYIPNLRTAIALLNRGWVKKARDCEQVSPKTLYYLTQRGRTALRIGARAQQ